MEAIWKTQWESRSWSPDNVTLLKWFSSSWLPHLLSSPPAASLCTVMLPNGKHVQQLAPASEHRAATLVRPGNPHGWRLGSPSSWSEDPRLVGRRGAESSRLCRTLRQWGWGEGWGWGGPLMGLVNHVRIAPTLLYLGLLRSKTGGEPGLVRPFSCSPWPFPALSASETLHAFYHYNTFI